MINNHLKLLGQAHFAALWVALEQVTEPLPEVDTRYGRISALKRLQKRFVYEFVLLLEYESVRNA